MAGILQVLPMRKSKNNVLECHKEKSMPRGKRKDLLAAERWQRGSSSAVTAAWRWWQCGGSASAGSVAVVLAARRRWQHDGGGKLGGCGRSLAASQRQQRQQSGGSCAAATRCHGSDEDTDGDSEGGGTTNNQQSTKSGSGNGNGNDDNNDTKNVSDRGSGGSLAAAQHWRWRQWGGGRVTSARWRQAAVRRRCSPSSSLMMNILCGAVVMGAGTTMFLICSVTNLLVDKNSVMYGLHTNIVPQYGYKGTN
jgi:hypothetical protein